MQDETTTPDKLMNELSEPSVFRSQVSKVKLQCSLDKTTARPAGLPRGRPKKNIQTNVPKPATTATETISAREGRASARATRKGNESDEDGGSKESED